jgi:lysylphosphatidylglycerol synthetase-like protein (DUF2156 family)
VSTELAGRATADLVMRYGGPVANGLFDPRCREFRAAGIDGVVGYRQAFRSAVALGDPVCSPSDLPRLAATFREHCAARRWSTVFAAGSDLLAATVCGWGGGAVEFGETLIFDPRRDPQAGARGRELRKKVFRARREGVVVREYQPARSGCDPGLERALEEVAAGWLAARHGLQVYLARVHLFEPRSARRWFYARVDRRVVGVLALLHLQAHRGYLLEHLLAAPASPIGVSELLVTDSFSTLAAEECAFATFGPAPASRLGRVRNLGVASEVLARSLFSVASRLFHLDGNTRFQRKFQVARTEPAHLVFYPARVDLRDVLGLVRAFNVSFW